MLILDSASQELAFMGSGLTIRHNGSSLKSLPLQLIERVVIYGSHTIETDIIGRIVREGASVLLLSGRHGRYIATVLGERHNDAQVRLGQYKAVSDPEHCRRWSRGLVLAKLRGQRKALTKILAERPDLSHPLFQPRESLRASCASLLASGSPALESVLGVEGSAARTYFDGFAAAFPRSLGFRRRVRRPPTDPVNACLSLVYTLLMYEAVTAAHCAGLDPALGFYHQPAFGRASLACDFIEPLRPRADYWVWSLFRERRLRSEHFHFEGSACFLGKAGRSAFYLAYPEFSYLQRRQLRRYAGLMARTIRATTVAV